MFCPKCGSEYRPGYARCAPCDVDLVEEIQGTLPGSAGADLHGVSQAVGWSEAEPRISYCGFLSLDEARQAREQLRREGIRSEILLREAPGSPPRDEYWLRISPRDFELAREILGDAPAGSTGGEVTCSACGASAAASSAMCRKMPRRR